MQELKTSNISTTSILTRQFAQRHFIIHGERPVKDGVQLVSHESSMGLRPNTVIGKQGCVL
jgi:hypothetical protein